MQDNLPAAAQALGGTRSGTGKAMMNENHRGYIGERGTIADRGP